MVASHLQVLDGHTDNATAIYTRNNLLNHVIVRCHGAYPLTRSSRAKAWFCIQCFAITTVLQAITNVHVSFLCLPGQTSGTTAIFVIIDGWAITITSVGDSLCIFDAQGGDVSLLTMDHKLEENVEEWVLITFWFVLLYYFAKQALEYHLRCKRQELCLSIKIEKNKIHNTIQCKLIEGNVFEHWIGPHWFFSELYLLQICICCGFTTWRWASLYLSLYCGD